MLESLDKVDWASLEDSCSIADYLPQLIWDVANDPSHTWSDPIESLYDTICHQGTASQAAYHVVPFLIELLQEPSVQNKRWILILLAHLANGSPLFEDRLCMPLPRESVVTPRIMNEADWQDREMLEYVMKLKQAVEKGIPIYHNLLNDSNPLTRMASAYALACLGPFHENTRLKLLERLFEEADPLSKSSLVLALSLGQKPTLALQMTPILKRLLHPSERDLVRVVAAMMLAYLVKSEAPDSSIEILIETLDANATLRSSYTELPWVYDGIIGDAGQFLCYFRPIQLNHTFPRLLQTISTGASNYYNDRRSRYDYDAARLIWPLLYITFEGQPYLRDRSYRELTVDQQTALMAIANNKPGQGFSWESESALQAFALPKGRSELRLFVGLEDVLFPAQDDDDLSPF
jgi:hypothetical protein